jgi:hypothetical protein
MPTVYEKVSTALKGVRLLTWIAPAARRSVIQEVNAALDCGHDTVPVWRYGDHDFAAVARELDSLISLRPWRELAEPVGSLVLTSLERSAETVAVIAGRDDAEFMVWSATRYGTPTETSLLSARALLSAPAPSGDALVDTAPRVGADDLAVRVRGALDAYSLGGWSIQIVEGKSASIGVQGLRRVIEIRSGETFSEEDIDRLLAHEVGSHVLRAENARHQPEPFAALALGDTVPTEEGLAAWHEEQLGVSSPSILRRYAARTIATDRAASAGVVAVARDLEPLVGRDEAVQIAIRAKRGLHDPNQPGAFTKDHGYLTGLIQVRQHLAGRFDDYPLLMATKWPIAELPLVRELHSAGLIRPGHRLPDAERLGLRSRLG